MEQPVVSTMGSGASSLYGNVLERRNFAICAVLASVVSLLAGCLFGAVIFPRISPAVHLPDGPVEQHVFNRCNGAIPCTSSGGLSDFEKACAELGGSTNPALGKASCFYKGQLTIFTQCNGARLCFRDGDEGWSDFGKACNELGGSTYDGRLGQGYCFYKGQLTIFTRCNGATCMYSGDLSDFEKACADLGGSAKRALGQTYCFYKGQLTIFERCNGARTCEYVGGSSDFEKACNKLGGSTYDALGQDYCFCKGELGKTSPKSKASEMLLGV